MKANTAFLTTIAVVLAIVICAPGLALGHCDGMDGPVVKAAQQALTTGNVNFALVWVQSSDEPEIKQAFARTLPVRKLNPKAKELADLYFLETLVRVHRAGEGEPYTGLKPAGRDLGPAIPAADKAIESGSVDALVKMLTGAASNGVRERFERLLARKNFRKDDVHAGREYVKAYVEYVHYVENLHEAAHRDGHEHAQESEAGDKRPAR